MSVKTIYMKPSTTLPKVSLLRIVVAIISIPIACASLFAYGYLFLEEYPVWMALLFLPVYVVANILIAQAGDHPVVYAVKLPYHALILAMVCTLPLAAVLCVLGFIFSYHEVGFWTNPCLLWLLGHGIGAAASGIHEQI